VITKIKAVINKIKEKEKVYVDDKSQYSNKITLLKKKIDDKYSEVRMLQSDKNILKEDFYSQMIDYEKQQLLLRDLEWLQQQKIKVLEREELFALQDIQRQKQKEQRDRMLAERKKRDEEYKQRQAERQKQEEERQRQWEEMQLAKLAAHPFEDEIDTCEQLLAYLAKNMSKAKAATETKQDAKLSIEEAARKKKIEEEVKKGQIQIAPSKKEREVLENELATLAQNKKQATRKKNEQPSKMYDVDPNAIDIDYSVVKKFGALGVAPPSSKDGLEKSEKELIELRDALNMAGKIQQAEGKARFLKDESFVQSDDYKAIKEKMDGVSKQLLASIARIRKDKEMRQHENDEGADAENDGERDGFTKLRPSGNRGRRGGRGRDD
jgi:hypothetical protein